MYPQEVDGDDNLCYSMHEYSSRFEECVDLTAGKLVRELFRCLLLRLGATYDCSNEKRTELY